MNAPLWAFESASAFWEAAGELERYPRDVRSAVLWTMPLTIVDLPRPRVADVFRWLDRHAVSCRIPAADRMLRACLLARSGSGVIVIDGTDSQDEQRFSIAHELAHFLRHYREPRDRAVERLGASVLDVLDGDRPPTPDERLLALLTRAPIGTQVHLMERDRDGEPAASDIERAEREADRLAFELLAPIHSVSRALTALPDGLDERRGGAIAILREEYGLPSVQAAQYAAILVPGPPESAIRRWGLAESRRTFAGSPEQF